MRIEDRLFLYALVRGIKPQRALETGVLRGGSSLIIANAMEDNGTGRLVGIDPGALVQVPSRLFFGRFELLAEPSPQAIPRAVELLGGPLDFALIDDIHIYSQVYAELKAVLPFMAAEGYILLHDAFNYGVHAAIEAFLAEADTVRDCGILSVSPQLQHDPWAAYGWMRLLRMLPPAGYVLRKVHEFYLAAQMPVPPSDPDIWDHDAWYCRSVKACPRCRRTAQ
ncbi:MAG: class I SAM-dependent methyltransferase [Candidatus Omnitrophica bacterium]|nr:class I SAM-dependent methyltransferase [Candidatus Omnitrophota bacterium]